MTSACILRCHVPPRSWQAVQSFGGKKMKCFKSDRKRLRLMLVVLVGAFVAGCGVGGSSDGSRVVAASCPTGQLSQLETAMDNTLSQADSAVAFSFPVERMDGRLYLFNRGASTMQTSY